MSNPEEIIKHPHGSAANERAIDAYIATFNAGAAARPDPDADRYETVGGFRIAKPAPTLEPPAEPIVTNDLPAAFLPYRDDIATGSDLAVLHGQGHEFAGIVGFLRGAIERGETMTPALHANVGENPASAAERYAATVRTELKRRYPTDDAAEEVEDLAVAAVKRFKLGRIISGLGLDSNLHLVEYMAGVERRARDAAAGAALRARTKDLSL